MANLGFIRRETSASQPLTDEPQRVVTGLVQVKYAHHSWWGSLIAYGLFVIFLFVWEYVSINRIIPSVFYPRPTVIGQTLVNWFSTTAWQPILLPTLQRLLVGFALGSAAGYGLGLVLGYSRRTYQIIDPILSVIYPLPKISLLPLALVVFGLGDAPRQFIIALGAFFPMVINTTAGVKTIGAQYFAMAHIYGARPITIFWRILLPGSLPLALTGLRIAFNSAFVVTVAVELNTARDGLGYIVWEAWQTMRTEYLYAGLVLIALIGVLSTGCIRVFEKWLIRWQS
jgi:ABC-type nitrate/sulfonate/bicarbonate transport system permease component